MEPPLQAGVKPGRVKAALCGHCQHRIGAVVAGHHDKASGRLVVEHIQQGLLLGYTGTGCGHACRQGGRVGQAEFGLLAWRAVQSGQCAGLARQVVESNLPGLFDRHRRTVQRQAAQQEPYE